MGCPAWGFPRQAAAPGPFTFARVHSRPILRTAAAVSFAVALLIASGAVPAQGADLDDVLEGFEETTVAEERGQPAAQERISPVDLTGSVGLSAVSAVHRHRSAAGTEFSGLTRLRMTLDLGLDASFPRSRDAVLRGRVFHDAAYGISGRDEFTDVMLGSLEREAELREAFLRGKVLPSLDLKVGRQIVVWGKSDNLRVTDVLNPLDNREPGLVDIEDLRLPLAMARADWYAGRWSLTAIAIPEVRFNKNPPLGSDFYPSALPPPRETIPEDGGGNTEYAFALNGILTGWDISFYSARIFNDQPSTRIIQFPFPQMEWVHDRLSMAGAAVNVALGNWLLKTEAALFDGLRFAARPDRGFSRLDALAGVEYSGFSETTISLEAVHRRLLDFDAALEAQPDGASRDAVQTALRLQRDFLRKRLHLTVLALTQAWNGRNGRMQRLSLQYDLTDRLACTAGFVNYTSGETREFREIGKNDRAFLEAKYSF